LDQLQLLGFEKLLRYTLGARLRAKEERPKLFAKRSGVFFEESGKLDLQGLDIRLVGRVSIRDSRLP
jgi:hypothetical protein